MGKAIFRTVVGLILGLFTMFMVITIIEFVGHRLYPPPAGLNPTRPDDLAAILAAQPFMAKLSVVVAWTLGTFAGGWVAARISRIWPRTSAVIVALVVIAAVIGMIVQLPQHPAWMAAMGLLLPIPAALLAAHLARPKAIPKL